MDESQLKQSSSRTQSNGKNSEAKKAQMSTKYTQDVNRKQSTNKQSLKNLVEVFEMR